MLILALLVGFAVFSAYAVYVHYNATPLTDSVPKRVWASVLAAGATAGAALMSWIHNATGS